MSLEKLQRQVAAKIKKTRKERGLLQKDFARYGLPLRQYQKIESGQLNLTLKTLFKVSLALDTEAERLLRSDEGALSYFQTIFHESPLGIIVWKLNDAKDPRSLTLFDYNRYASQAVYRDLPQLRGKSLSEIFPKGEEQGLLKILFDVITTGKAHAVPELLRHDQNFPLTVFSTKFVKCAPDLGAALFRDITQEYLDRQENQRRQRFAIESERLPYGGGN